MSNLKTIFIFALIFAVTQHNFGAGLIQATAVNPIQEQDFLNQDLNNLVGQKRDIINNLDEMKVIVRDNDVLKIPKKEELKVVFEKLAGPLGELDQQINELFAPLGSLQLNNSESIIDLLQKLSENNFLEELNNFFAEEQNTYLKENLAQLVKKELALKENLKTLLINVHADLNSTKDFLINYMSFKTDCLLFLFDFPTKFFTEIFSKDFPKINELLLNEAKQNKKNVSSFKDIFKLEDPALNWLDITSNLIRDIARANIVTLDKISVNAKYNLNLFEGKMEALLTSHLITMMQEKNALKRLLDETKKLDEANKWNKEANKRLAGMIGVITCSAGLSYITNPTFATLGGVGMVLCWIQGFTSYDIGNFGYGKIGTIIIAGLVCKLIYSKLKQKNKTASQDANLENNDRESYSDAPPSEPADSEKTQPENEIEKTAEEAPEVQVEQPINQTDNANEAIVIEPTSQNFI